jgi:hypothetical protein
MDSAFLNKLGLSTAREMWEERGVNVESKKGGLNMLTPCPLNAKGKDLH